MSIIIFLITITIITIAIAVFLKHAPQVGAQAEGKRLERIQQSPNYKNGKFVNPIKTPMNPEGASIVKGMWKFFSGGDSREPAMSLPAMPLDSNRFNDADSDSAIITWLGHSTMLIEIEGKTFITDPMFSERASMLSFAGPKHFEYDNRISIEQLPPIDAIIISHDHYDHLDYQSILKLHPKVEKIFVPLGVGAHLEKWGVPVEKIVESDWWDESNLGEKFKLVCTPARHFSGRGLADRFNTLWCSWVIISENHRIYFGGDSGYFPGFEEIGKKYGPFDITMIECGAYSKYWPYIHIMPEEAVQANLDLRGKVLLPIHWGKFNLSIHSWIEPVERLLKKADELNVNIATPLIGESFTLNGSIPNKQWWREK